MNVAWLPKICVLTFVTLLDYLEFPYKEEIIIHILINWLYFLELLGL